MATVQRGEWATPVAYYMWKKGSSTEDSKKEVETKKDGKPAKKPVVAKSTVTLNVMPYDPEKPITGLYDTIKKIEIPGLVWSAIHSTLKGPFGLEGLVFGCVIEDALVKIDDVEEALETIGMAESDKTKYLDLRRQGDLEDYEEEWPNKVIGTVKVVSFQKL